MIVCLHKIKFRIKYFRYKFLKPTKICNEKKRKKFLTKTNQRISKVYETTNFQSLRNYENNHKFIFVYCIFGDS